MMTASDLDKKNRIITKICLFLTCQGNANGSFIIFFFLQPVQLTVYVSGWIAGSFSVYDF